MRNLAKYKGTFRTFVATIGRKNENGSKIVLEKISCLDDSSNGVDDHCWVTYSHRRYNNKSGKIVFTAFVKEYEKLSKDGSTMILDACICDVRNIKELRNDR